MIGFRQRPTSLPQTQTAMFRLTHSLLTNITVVSLDHRANFTVSKMISPDIHTRGSSPSLKAALERLKL
jgi:hypothetical protein